jgi:hypothetical protein
MIAGLIAITAPIRALDVEILRSTGSLPPHIVGMFSEPLGFQQTPGGPYYVFDRRGHSVFMVDSDRSAAQKLIDIGQEQGRIIQPRGFDVSPTGSIVVADAPRGVERVQTFGPAGLRQSGFTLPGQPIAAITLGTMVLNGVGSIQFAGDNLLISHPESGTLITEYSRWGVAQRSIGQLRTTGFEQDRAVHLALNAGLPLVDPTGGFYYVFLGGRPMFRKYNADGSLAFERHIEGRELDGHIAMLPTRWPTRRLEDRGRRGRQRPALGVADRAVYLRLRSPGRQEQNGPVLGRWHHQPDEPVLHARRAAARHAWLLRIPSLTTKTTMISKNTNILFQERGS